LPFVLNHEVTRRTRRQINYGILHGGPAHCTSGGASVAQVWQVGATVGHREITVEFSFTWQKGQVHPLGTSPPWRLFMSPLFKWAMVFLFKDSFFSNFLVFIVFLSYFYFFAFLKK
jgi:hypothetical protein